MVAVMVMVMVVVLLVLVVVWKLWLSLYDEGNGCRG